jgi:aminopeptidase N
LRPEAQEINLTGLTEYHLTVALGPDLTRITGQARIRYTNREQAPLDCVYLHLFPNLWEGGMTVSEVTEADRPVSATLESWDALLRVPLAAPLLPGEMVELALRFTEPIPSGAGVGNYGEFAFQDGVLALAHFYPTVVAYDSGWRLETPSSAGDVIYHDASLYDVILIAPADLTVVATGATLDRTDDGYGTATWHLAGGPLRDFNVVAGREYRSTRQQVGGVTLTSYYLPQDAAGGKQTLEWAVRALRTYEAAFGAYPYRELDVVETFTSAGGIEYPGMIVVAGRFYSDPTRRDFFEAATVHEVAHQWWYNVVGNDQVNAPWLDEALAQYSTYLYFRSAYGEAGARGFADSLEERWEWVNRDPKPIGLPVAAYQDREYGAIVYGRGPLFFLALRDQIGEEKMAEFLRRYYADYAWGIATPAGFQALAEEVSGQDLSALFTEWIYP